MGVPAFFRKLIKKYKIIRNSPEKPIKALYIDANCLFHPQCFKVLDMNKNVTDQKFLFKKMADRIIAYIDYLIRLTNPSELVYIAVDGVAPLAKINQQRMRRFGYANNYRNEIYKKYGMPVNENWSNIVITPGTIFMYNLHRRLKNHYERHVANNTDPKCTYKIIYDSYLTPGEGEHKILQHLKKFVSKTERNAIVIYGLDADLIFLSMASQIPNIYLLRESDQFTRSDDTIDPKDLSSIEEDLCFADIDFAKQSINDEFNEYYMHYIAATKDGNPDTYMFGEEKFEGPLERNIDRFNFTNDYIFMCYFLGNDFLPHLPSIDINMEGMEILFNVYMDVFQDLGKNLISLSESGQVSIDTKFIQCVLVRLSTKEHEFFKRILPESLLRHAKRRCNEFEPHKKELWRIENLKDVKIEDVTRLGDGNPDEWKYRYYSHYFKCSEHMQETVDKCCENYFEGLLWVTRYYFESCPTWRWQYKFTHAPFLSDLSVYLSNNEIILNCEDYLWSKSLDAKDTNPVDMFTQLVSVVPSTYSNILPKSLRNLNNSPTSPIIDMFPLTYKSDMINKTQLFKCVSMHPYLDIERVEKIVKRAKLLNDELIRCKKIEAIDIGKCKNGTSVHQLKPKSKSKKIAMTNNPNINDIDVFS